MTRRLLLLVLAAACLGLAACGNKPDTVTHGESEAEYVTLGNMQYQVQLSRQINPGNIGDQQLLVGLPPRFRGLKRGEIWFGVWVRVFNKTGNASPAANEFKVVDTRGKVFAPIPLDHVNVFAYRPTEVPAGGEYPFPGSAQANAPTTGALVLFKLPVDALDFRPLELGFTGPGASGESTVRLDV